MRPLKKTPRRTVQTKLTAGAPEDVYEQEADRVAGQVMTLPEAATQRPNQTGLPDGLKSGIESLSGISMDSVNVHYNSSQPAQLNALAYTQGSDIHVAPGQEHHLPHEAWHVVQQAQGRVQPTMQMKDGVPVNDDEGLEHEADVMGAKALAPATQLTGGPEEEELLQGKSAPVQRRQSGFAPREDDAGGPGGRLFGHAESAQRVPAVQRDPEFEEKVGELTAALEELWSLEDHKQSMLQAIERVYTKEKAVQATRDPAVAKAILAFVNGKQSKIWTSGTVRKQPENKKPLTDAEHWTLRHYTDKYVWDAEGKVVNPPPYMEILSALTLAAMKGGAEKSDEEAQEPVTGGKVGADKSGHTSKIDWDIIGNVGDTFFALFYKGELAGQKQTFLNKAQWYAEWRITDVEQIWVSSDWLGKAKTQGKKPEAPRGLAYEGSPSDVVSACLGMFGQKGDEKAKRKIFEDQFDNFEVKVHGPLALEKSSIHQVWQRVDSPPPTKEEKALQKT